ncbi:hypothetical protein GCM10009827_077980 [Dactylosporangium maewongense]|uniref:Uncharacterized protein n=1 Tax=Dactylosporangium maewongense TaxID=634393 RepID=A0ABN2BRJ6_9ACTN
MTKRIGGAALALAAVAFFATACGSSDSAAPATAASGTDYASCLRDNGVNLPQMNGSGRPTARPDGNASGRPTAFPSGQPRPSGSGGFRGGGGGFFGTAAPNGVDQQTWEKAQKACESLRPTAFPSGGFGNGGGGGNGGGRDAAYRNCLTEHGVTVSGPVDQLDTADAKVAAAVTACAPLKPSPRPSAS